MNIALDSAPDGIDLLSEAPEPSAGRPDSAPRRADAAPADAVPTEDGDAVAADAVDAYAAWVRSLRTSGWRLPPRLNPADPLRKVGHELMLLADAVERRERELLRLLDLVQHALQGMLLDDVLKQIYDGFEGIIPYDRIGCAFLSDDGRSLSAYWAKSKLPRQVLRVGYTQPMAGSSLVTVLATGQPRIINDLVAYLAARPESVATSDIVAEGGRSSLTCPLFADSQPIGFLFFTSARPNTYDERHQNIFRQIAGQVSLLISRSRTNTALVSHNKFLTQRSRELESAVAQDSLTGLLNRGAIDMALQHALSCHMGCGVILADIDLFKQINDTFGHAAGDAVLKQFALRIGETLRKSDVVGRYGGEEFLIVAHGTSDDNLAGMAERMRRRIEETPFDTGAGPLRVTASFGLALADDDTRADLLVDRADRALYRAKAAGRNQVMPA